jgi:hypothetical protein
MSETAPTNEWMCPNCKAWIPSGNYHICGGMTGYKYEQPTASYSWPAYIDNNALNRIADALEKLVELLEKQNVDV